MSQARGGQGGRESTTHMRGSSGAQVGGASTSHVRGTETSHARGTSSAGHMRGTTANHMRGSEISHARGTEASHMRGTAGTHMRGMSASHMRGTAGTHMRGMSASHMREAPGDSISAVRHMRGEPTTHMRGSTTSHERVARESHMNDTIPSNISMVSGSLMRGVSASHMSGTVSTHTPPSNHAERMSVGRRRSGAKACQFVMFSNDAVDVAYTDGSRLQLSPCGSVFVYHHAPSPDAHPLQACEKVQHGCEFATSNYRDQVLQALELRNRYAHRPFVCRRLLKERVVRVHAAIEEVAWPTQLTFDNITYLPSGGIKVVSEDEYASISLSYHHLDFTIEYLAKVSQHPHKLKSKLASTQNEGHQVSNNESSSSSSSSSPSSPSVSGSRGGKEEDGRWDHVWLTQHHSVQDCPPCWKHIVTLMLKLDVTVPSNIQQKNETTFNDEPLPEDCAIMSSAPDVSINEQDRLRRDNKRSPEGVSSDKSCDSSGSSIRRMLKKDFSHCVFSPVPKSLPLNCGSQHLHHWRQNDMIVSDEVTPEVAYMPGKVKVICIQGVIYRLLRSPEHVMEVYPGDGSIIRSSGLSGYFFSHYLYFNHKVEERMYSLKSPPLHNPAFNYSPAKIISRASRFLQQMCDSSSQLAGTDDICCWKRSPSVSAGVNVYHPTVVLEECEVPGVGRFLAKSNGHISIVFTDRTSLDMCIDISKRLALQRMPVAQIVDDSGQVKARYMSASQILNLPEGVCRLLLRTGHYHHVIVNNPEGYERYIQPAVEWASWVNTLPSQRSEFYKDTLYDPDKQKMIDREIKKIKCFNYIVEQSINPSKFPPEPEQASPDVHHADRAASDHHGNRSSPALPPPDAAVDNMDFATVRDVLKRTSMAIKKLDQVLGPGAEMEPVRD